MKKYYYNDGTTRFGPYTIEELKDLGVTPDTQIWYEGLADWTYAKNLVELDSLFNGGATTVPPINNGGSREAKRAVPPPSNLVWAILTTILCCLPFGIVSIVYATKVETAFYNESEERSLYYSKQAEKWAIISAVASVVGAILYIIIVATSGMAFSTF